MKIIKGVNGKIPTGILCHSPYSCMRLKTYHLTETKETYKYTLASSTEITLLFPLTVHACLKSLIGHRPNTDILSQ